MLIVAALIAAASLQSPVVRPRPTYIEVPAPQRAPAQLRAAGDPLVLFMNKDGGSFTCANDDADHNESSIACSDSDGVADVTGFSGSASQWSTVMSCLTDMYAPFNMTVTDVKPAAGTTYVEAVIGGSPDQAGQPNGVAGVAPFTCGFIPGAIVYDFADVWGNDTQSICETAAQEIAHAFGLDHEFMCADPMTYLTDCGPKSFQDAWVPCGEYEPRECSCGDPTQNSVNAMMTMFGPADGTSWTPPVDTEPPTVTIDGPADGAILPANGEMVVSAHVHDDAGFTLVELQWDFTGEAMYCPAGAGGAYTCSQNGEVVTWTIQAGLGSRTFRAHVRDLAGNEVTTDDVTVWLSPDGKGPPEDLAAPTIVLGAPLPDTVMPAATPFDVVATMVDDTGIARAELNWQRQGQDNWIPCPYEDTRLKCVVSGSTYRWTVQGRRDGVRTFQLRATDLVGKVTTTDMNTVNIMTGATLPATDGNDGLDEAAVLSCGDSVDVSGLDADWFVIDAPGGDDVTVSVKGADTSLLATDGKSVLGQSNSDASLHVKIGDVPVSVGVSPASSAGGGATVSVVCKSPAKPAPKGCTATDVPSIAALAGLLACLRRRRR